MKNLVLTTVRVSFALFAVASLTTAVACSTANLTKARNCGAENDDVSLCSNYYVMDGSTAYQCKTQMSSGVHYTVQLCVKSSTVCTS